MPWWTDIPACTTCKAIWEKKKKVTGEHNIPGSHFLAGKTRRGKLKAEVFA
jgi:hypothetical protein